MIKEITSRQNSIIMQVKKLKNKKNREMTSSFIVEGYRNVLDSIKLSEPLYIFITDAFNPDDFSLNCNIYKVTEKIFADISDTKTPQGVLGVFKIPEFNSKNISDKIILLNGVSDPGNVGTILRTSLATGFNTVILDKDCADVYSLKTARSAMSALFSLNISRVDSLPSFINNNDFTYYAAALLKNSEDLYDINFDKKTALIFGSEASGIEPELLREADITYKIPMSEKIESLNVAVAAAVSQYEVLRQSPDMS